MANGQNYDGEEAIPDDGFPESFSTDNEHNSSADEEEDTQNHADVPLEERRGKRGPVQMHRIMKIRQKGEKIELKFDGKRDTKDELQSYIGRLVREHAPIDIKTWKDIPKSIKERIWAEVKETFHIDDRRMKKQLVGAGTKWRKWKSSLHTRYVKDKFPKSRPPKVRQLYKSITKEQWINFVKCRKTTEFKKLAAEQSARRKLFEYDHHLSRKGYAKLEREMQKELGTKARIPRPILWKRARQKKNGNYFTEAVKTMADKIDSYIEKEKQGTFKPHGKNDALTAALGTSEHDGRVRAQSQFVTQKIYFGSSHENRSSSAQDAEIGALKAQVKLLTVTVEKLLKRQTGVVGSHEDQMEYENPTACEKEMEHRDASRCDREMENKNASPHDIEMEDAPKGDPNPSGGTLGKGTPCMLCCPTLDNVIAHGKAYMSCAPNSKLHGITLGEKVLRVSVDVVVDPSAELPIQNDEYQTVLEACGTHVAWPMDLVSFDMMPTSKEKNNLKKVVPQQSMCQKTKKIKKTTDKDIQKEIKDKVPKSDSANSSNSPRVKQSSALTKVTNKKLLPSAQQLRPVVWYAEREMTNESLICINMPRNLIGIQPMIYLGKADILEFSTMVEISADCITLYIKHLHKYCSTHGLLDKFSFVSPSFMSHSMSKDNLERKRADILLQVFNQVPKNQLILFPYNIGKHWMLVIINPWNDEVFWIDHLRRKVHKDILQVVTMALSDFKLQHGSVKFHGKNGCTKWTIVHAPKQPGSVECGFLCVTIYERHN